MPPAISIKNYFESKCNNEVKQNPKSFWKTVKPFISDKNIGSNGQSITLKIEENIINEPKQVCDAFNDYFSTVADHIGDSSPLETNESLDDILHEYDDHDSIIKIKSYV